MSGDQAVVEKTSDGTLPAATETDSVERALLIKLTIAARQLIQAFDRDVEQAGITRAKFGVIAIVARHPGATQRSIAEALSVTEVTAGRLIERLCADGYLERRAKSNDRRAHCIFLTTAAQPLLDSLAAHASVQEAAALDGLDDGQKATMVALLDRILANISAARAGA